MQEREISVASLPDRLKKEPEDDGMLHRSPPTGSLLLSTAAPRPSEPGDAPRVLWRFDNSYTRLPDTLFARCAPTPVRAPEIVVVNDPLARALGLDPGALRAEAAATLGGNALPEGAEPIAQAYAGHQFGHFTMLGDGRALLLGEHLAPDGKRFDIALKGSGPTPFSRRGDGRAAVGPMLREYIVSEAMAALGIPTTRSLAVVASGEPVYRETVLSGAVLTRIAASHLRVGTFQYAAARREEALLRTLADYSIARHDPDLAGGGEEKYAAWLRAIIERQASLVARWLHCGFIHGVMNTDNMALSGETIDFGPCAFMDAYDPATVFSSIDHQGRYAYANQPGIAHWNLCRFAEAILPLLHADRAIAIARAESALEEFPAVFERRWLSGMRRKLGLFGAEEGDRALGESLLASLQERGADYTNAMRSLSTDAPAVDDDWHERWRARLARQAEPLEAARALVRESSPAIIPRNHRVEEALAAAVEGDLSVMEQLLTALARPYDDVPGHEAYREPPPAGAARGYRTFCGT
jgi:uncharacterized protein YdiU (UPF0061 family)